MTQVMETLESRQMFSVTAVEPTDLPVDTSAPTEVVVAKSIPKLIAACVKGKTFSKVEIHSTMH